ncbi:MAG: hypothetical protein R3245_00785, partial [Kiloniellales bacterium]|nr:hypothetical protein [Kiloniellales bacterium]
KAKTLLGFADKLAQGRDGSAFRTGMALLRWWIADLTRSGVMGEDPRNVIWREEVDLRSRLLSWRPAPVWLTFWDRLGQQEKAALQANLDIKQVVITAFLELETLEA